MAPPTISVTVQTIDIVITSHLAATKQATPYIFTGDHVIRSTILLQDNLVLEGDGRRQRAFSGQQC